MIESWNHAITEMKIQCKLCIIFLTFVSMFFVQTDKEDMKIEEEIHIFGHF